MAKFPHDSAMVARSVHTSPGETTLRLLKLAIGLCALSQLQGCLFASHNHASGDLYAISLDADVKDIGSSGLAIIQNLSSSTLKFNLCRRVLERRENNRWALVDTIGVKTCDPALHDLPGKIAVDTYVSLPRTAPPGTYRLVFIGLLGPNGQPLSGDARASSAFVIR